MVEVFKTDVQETERAERITTLLLERFPEYKINFDLGDCEKILRVENRMGEVECCEITKIVESFEYKIEVIAD